MKIPLLYPVIAISVLGNGAKNVSRYWTFHSYIQYIVVSGKWTALHNCGWLPQRNQILRQKFTDSQSDYCTEQQICHVSQAMFELRTQLKLRAGRNPLEALELIGLPSIDSSRCAAFPHESQLTSHDSFRHPSQLLFLAVPPGSTQGRSQRMRHVSHRLPSPCAVRTHHYIAFFSRTFSSFLFVFISFAMSLQSSSVFSESRLVCSSNALSWARRSVPQVVSKHLRLPRYSKHRVGLLKPLRFVVQTG